MLWTLFVVLLVLWLLGVVSDYTLGGFIHVLLVLAVWKALLVALYFMHLRFETFRLWILAVGEGEMPGGGRACTTLCRRRSALSMTT